MRPLIFALCVVSALSLACGRKVVTYNDDGTVKDESVELGEVEKNEIKADLLRMLDGLVPIFQK